jgi:cytochrome c oxidase cbb3-type subunit 2
MIKNSILIIGIVALFLFAMIGLTILPKIYIEPNVEKANVYVWGRAAEGHKVYVSHGCIYCHSQQVRPKGFGADIERGWGRASVATDYKGLSPHQLGTMRTGPDLSNIAQRQPSRDWHLLHLYNPRAVIKESIMPPYPFLFEIVDADKTLKEGLKLPPEYQLPGKKVIPTDEANALVDYLLSLNQKDPIQPQQN